MLKEEDHQTNTMNTHHILFRDFYVSFNFFANLIGLTSIFGLIPVGLGPEIYIYSAPNKSNETYTFMCLGRAGRLGSAKTALKFKYEI